MISLACKYEDASEKTTEDFSVDADGMSLALYDFLKPCSKVESLPTLLSNVRRHKRPRMPVRHSANAFVHGDILTLLSGTPANVQSNSKSP